MTCTGDDQQFCLRWNNFQANITSQFEALRDDEDFTDVTIACDGQRIQAHKIVLSACSPFFKELFKTNPCTHPIIFMRDVESQHITALIEFMYTGEVNVAQAQLSTFLKTAESLKIRGLTDTSTDCPKDDNQVFLNPERKVQFSLTPNTPDKERLINPQVSSCSSTVTSSQDITCSPSPSTPPPPKRQCKEKSTFLPIETTNDDLLSFNSFVLPEQKNDFMEEENFQPKIELPEYLSDEDGPSNIADLTGGMEIIPHLPSANYKENTGVESLPGRIPHRRILDDFFSLPSNSKSLRKTGERKTRLVKLGEGIEIHEDQLRSVKWNDYRKLTRGLATILFSPAELATCSVTGQRWSRAGSVERPVKPALDRAKVQAIISYVATRFPMVEISRIKQVLAYKCKENSTAFKMKAVRHYGDRSKSQD